MKPMSPSNSHHRLRNASMRGEPTDLQKTARVAMIRSRQRTARLGSVVKGWPTANAVKPKDNVAFNADGKETWQRPEPNPIYRDNFTKDLKTFESKSITEEALEDELKALNANIMAREAAGEALSPDDSEVKEAIDTYNNLLNTRGTLETTGSRIASGVEIDYRNNRWPYGIGGIAGFVICYGLFRWYRKGPISRKGPRYVGTKDRLSVFGNF